MWGAIIQAIDHAMGRLQEGAGAGIKVANSQHGGGAPISNMDSGAGAVAKQDLRNQQDTTSEQEEAAEQSKIGSNSTSTGTDAGGQAAGGAGALGSIGAGASGSIGAGGAGTSGSIGAGGAGASGGIAEAASGGIGAGASGGIAEAASSILSDENAKTSKPVGKLQPMRAYGANIGKGFANAGAVATGSKAAEWEDIDNSFAKKAAEDTVKGWRKKDFKVDSTNK